MVGGEVAFATCNTTQRNARNQLLNLLIIITILTLTISMYGSSSLSMAHGATPVAIKITQQPTLHASQLIP